jgi:hypothetical protein
MLSCELAKQREILGPVVLVTAGVVFVENEIENPVARPDRVVRWGMLV